MKVLLLAGGFGTRLSEESAFKPKPMVEIGGKPILWHIMNIYAHYGFNDFVILCGYKGHIIKEYFHNYYLHNSDLTIDLKHNHMDIIRNDTENWKVTLLETGLNTMTGGRIKYAKDIVGGERFMLTYGDGVSNVDLHALIQHHDASGKAVTMTAVRPTPRFGGLQFNDHQELISFKEKPQTGEGWINGGYFVCEPDLFDVIDDDSSVLEKDPLERLLAQNKLGAYQHSGFWQCMDTLREKNYLNELWDTTPPWKVW